MQGMYPISATMYRSGKLKILKSATSAFSSAPLALRFRARRLIEEVNDDEDLFAVRDVFVAHRELMFAELPKLLDPSTDAVLIRLTRLTRAGSWKYMAIIDCRGPKKARAYFSKWH